MRKAIAGGVVSLAVAAATIVMGAGMAHAQAKSAHNAVQVLDHGWQFRQVAAAGQQSESGWMPATVPGDVHLDLLANKKIPDPFYRDNESKLQWIEKESWEYRVSFDVTPALLARSNVDLVFDGLDAAAQVYVNGVQLLTADNMFRDVARAGQGEPARRQEPAARGLSLAHRPPRSSGGPRSLAAQDQDRRQNLHSQGRL